MINTRVVAAAAVAGVFFLAACGRQDSGSEQDNHDASPAASMQVTTHAAPSTSTESPIPTTSAAAAPSAATTLPPPPPALTPTPPTIGEIDARSPDQIVAESGARGQRYLAALRAAGIPPTGMEAAEVLYAQGTCQALAQGDSRASVLAEFDSVGRTYAQFLPMTASQIAEAYVSTAERTYC
ncbi:dihydrofolate reductase [Rhodococcus sp. ABRD24]|uniref:DUF732 domain-containing protein n=1 Tax=Rhodococcus sp. ABRD24 TaxID=2507582 RepID=UPI00103CCCA7|nr:DUF732 domain-containing protein [Rhodococcus sp. ABRD24]QBJ96558.1 dihydrofolate reductase [Rhodococcus sp. ABRD24]